MISKQFLFLFSLFLFTSLIYSQTNFRTGTILDSGNKPLESANIIAKPLQENASLKFAISGNKSLFKMKT